MKPKKSKVSVKALPLTTVSTEIIYSITDYEVPTNFITVSDEYIMTSDGQMFFVAQ